MFLTIYRCNRQHGSIKLSISKFLRHKPFSEEADWTGAGGALLRPFGTDSSFKKEVKLDEGDLLIFPFNTIQ